MPARRRGFRRFGSFAPVVSYMKHVFLIDYRPDEERVSSGPAGIWRVWARRETAELAVEQACLALRATSRVGIRHSCRATTRRLACTSRRYTEQVRGSGMGQEFATAHATERRGGRNGNAGIIREVRVTVTPVARCRSNARRRPRPAEAHQNPLPGFARAD